MLPVLVGVADEEVQLRFLEFFAANIRKGSSHRGTSDPLSYDFQAFMTRYFHFAPILLSPE